MSPSEADPGGQAFAAAVLVALLAAYAGFYVYVPFDSTVRLVAFAGMFVFMIVVVALLILFNRWWRGAGG